jgi:hypothetical protein
MAEKHNGDLQRAAEKINLTHATAWLKIKGYSSQKNLHHMASWTAGMPT